MTTIHPYAGSESTRQAADRPGHCEYCVEYGHVVTHPSYGCADVGCEHTHETENQINRREAQRQANLVADRLTDLADRIRLTARRFAMVTSRYGEYHPVGWLASVPGTEAVHDGD